MRFFLDEIVARIVAIYLCIDGSRQLWRALVERKIKYFNPDLLNWYLDWSNARADRDSTPVQYWIQIGFRILLLIASLVVAIFGWWRPDA